MAIYMCTKKRYDMLASEHGTKKRACQALNTTGRILPEITDIKVHTAGKGHKLPALNRQEARKELGR